MKVSLGTALLGTGACVVVAVGLTLYLNDGADASRPRATPATDRVPSRAQRRALEGSEPPPARSQPLERVGQDEAPVAVTSANEASPPPLTREQSFDRAELAFYRDPGHSAWSMAAETEVKQRVFGTQGVAGATLRSLECRRIGCRLELSYSEPAVAEAMADKLTEVQSFDRAQINFFWTDDSKREQVVFVVTPEAIAERIRDRDRRRSGAAAVPVDRAP